MARKTKADAEKTREDLLDAAEIVFLKKGVAHASLADVASLAGVTRGALYWHFENKQALFHAMQERVKLPIDTLREQALREENPYTALQTHCVQVLQNLAKDAHMQRVFSILLFKCEQIDEFAEDCVYRCDKREKLLDQFREVFAWARKKQLLRPDTNIDKAAIGLHAYILGLFTSYLRAQAEFNMEVDAPSLIAQYFRGL